MFDGIGNDTGKTREVVVSKNCVKVKVWTKEEEDYRNALMTSEEVVKEERRLFDKLNSTESEEEREEIGWEIKNFHQRIADEEDGLGVYPTVTRREK